MPLQGRIRVLFVIGELAGGGGEHLLCNLIERMDQAAFDLSVCPLWPIVDLSPRIEAAGVPLVAVHKRSRYDWSVIPRLGSYIRSHNIDVVHTWMATANIWGRLGALWGRAPVIITAEHLEWFTRPAILTLFENLALPFTDAVIAVSGGVQKWYRNGLVHSADKCRLLYNGIDLARFDRERLALEAAEWKTHLGLPDESLVVGTVANLRPQKNYPNFLRAARLVCQAFPQAHFVAVGEGTLRGEIEQLIAEMGLTGRVTLTGYVQRPELITAAFDVFTLASDAEGLSLAMLEAMALGVPVVVTDVGGAREVIGAHDAGILVPPRSPEVLAEAICDLLSDSEKAGILGQRGKALVHRQFSLEAMVQAHEALYRELMLKHSIARA